jgi:hypothetical protein
VKDGFIGTTKTDKSAVFLDSHNNRNKKEETVTDGTEKGPLLYLYLAWTERWGMRKAEGGRGALDVTPKVVGTEENVPLPSRSKGR